MTIYTRAGDQGETTLSGGPKIVKDAPRLEASGTVDELSAVVGLVRAEPLSDDVDRLLERVQHELQEILGELGSADPGSADPGSADPGSADPGSADPGSADPAAPSPCRIGPAQIRAIEEAIDRHQHALPPAADFILPAGVRPAAQLHVARTVCRRAERRLVTLLRAEQPEISTAITAYLNRLGDLLFVLARYVNRQAGCREIVWRKQP
jgi:cob(I)alamin adenosyltransferase